MLWGYCCVCWLARLPLVGIGVVVQLLGSMCLCESPLFSPVAVHINGVAGNRYMSAIMDLPWKLAADGAHAWTAGERESLGLRPAVRVDGGSSVGATTIAGAHRATDTSR